MEPSLPALASNIDHNSIMELIAMIFFLDKPGKHEEATEGRDTDAVDNITGVWRRPGHGLFCLLLLVEKGSVCKNESATLQGIYAVVSER
jgi:hypothetical protein